MNNKNPCINISGQNIAMEENDKSIKNGG